MGAIKMKIQCRNRFIILAAIILCLFSLTGCSVLSAIDEGLKANKKKSDDKYWTERNVPPVEIDITFVCPGEEVNFDTDLRVSRCVYKYLEDGDKKHLKDMFAKSVIDSHKALEGELGELIDFYGQLEVSEIEMKSNGVYKVHRLEPAETIVEYTYRSVFVYNSEEYQLDILFVKEATADKDILGVHGIRLRNRDANKSVIVNTTDTDI